MLITLQEAKEKYGFKLANFCIMPTHIHLLIKPAEGTNLSNIIHWIKLFSAKRWNFIHGAIDHMWGQRFYSRCIRNTQEFYFIMNYIDQNPVAAELAANPADWKASGAYYRANELEELIDYAPYDFKRSVILL